MSTDSSVEVPAPAGVPAFDVNLQADSFFDDPFPTYDRIRDAGPVVWMSRYGYYASARYDEVAAILSDTETFTSAEGVGFNPMFNGIKETSLQTEGHQHNEIRMVEGYPMRPGPIEELKPRLRGFAGNLVDELRQRDRLDAVDDIAKAMPIEIVTDLVGVEGLTQEQLFDYGVSGFNSIGPLFAPRTAPALEHMAGYVAYAEENFPDKVRDGGWADQLFKNGKEAGWSDELCRGVMNDYIYPSIDSTVAAIGFGVLLFGQHPGQWDMLRNDRTLLPNAIAEIVRWASPLQFFTRVATCDTEVSGVRIPEGSRVIVMFGAANRDERKFPNPSGFDITRSPLAQLGFGRGKHSCLGKPLANLEMTTLFDVLADHVERFHIGEYRYEPNNVIRGLAELELTITWSDR
jgi:cytochrome P450